MNDTAEKPVEQLKREDWVRQVLEGAAKKLESLAGNTTYRQAWRKAAKIVREMKP